MSPFVSYFSALYALKTTANEILKSIYRKLPQATQNIINAELGTPNGISSIHVSPDPGGVLWAGIGRTLEPEREIRLLRLALRNLQNGNYQGATADAIGAVRGLSKYGTVTFE